MLQISENADTVPEYRDRTMSICSTLKACGFEIELPKTLFQKLQKLILPFQIDVCGATAQSAHAPELQGYLQIWRKISYSSMKLKTTIQ